MWKVPPQAATRKREQRLEKEDIEKTLMEPEHFLIKKAFRLVSLFFSLLIPILRPYPKKGKATEDFKRGNVREPKRYKTWSFS